MLPAFTLTLPRPILRRAAADLTGEHAAEVVAIREAGFDSDLIDGFVGESKSFAREADSRGENVSGRCLAGVLAEAANKALHTHAGTFGEEVICELCVWRTSNEC